MAKAAARKTGVTGWRLIVSLVLLAFTFQSYVAQTHIHQAANAATAALVKKLGHSKSPVDNSPLDCPFCQAVTHAGNFFMPVAPLLFLSAQWIDMAAPHTVLRASDFAASHGWQSRAPPHP